MLIWRKSNDSFTSDRCPMFKLRKWYFDVLTEDLKYFFVYFAVVRVGRIVVPSLNIHVAHAKDGQSRTVSIPVGHVEETTAGDPYVRIVLPGGGISVDPERCSLEFSSDRASASLQYVSEGHYRQQGVRIESPLRSFIRWIPFGLKYIVAGWISVGDTLMRVHRANGYADYLKSTCLPPIVPVRNLYWGRLHHPDIDVVYMHAAGGDGTPSWSGLEGVHAGRGFGPAACTLATSGRGRHLKSRSPGQWDYRVEGSPGMDLVRVQVSHSVPVQEGSFIDQQTIASPILRAGAKFLTRNPRSTKYLSFADLVIEKEGREVKYDHLPFIDECASL